MVLSFFRQKAVLAARMARDATEPYLKASYETDERTWLDLARLDEHRHAAGIKADGATQAASEDPDEVANPATMSGTGAVR